MYYVARSPSLKGYIVVDLQGERRFQCPLSIIFKISVLPFKVLLKGYTRVSWYIENRYALLDCVGVVNEVQPMSVYCSELRIRPRYLATDLSVEIGISWRNFNFFHSR